ncbi:hypothetical protein HW130_12160 [Streptomyces sp. PKU-EA00015]|uniref:hypothetical protein n=1 Tax=Streptomyces sp. PKU-EA00015 TaxID=2748326 RepID=UPI0015A274FF|nr:hypothetical protein [Streptomyces sp. PKU-EA00015]NWF27015.1 hypothetical protein [Streptomyces sp. PKU-EA00015]
MNAMHQYMIDNYRAAVRGDQVPPQPGRHDRQVIREIGEYRRFRRVAACRPAEGRVRRAVTRLLRPRPARR